MIRICCVCLGNICRSPTAEAVLAHLIDEAGLAEAIEVDGAGTSAWHMGEPPDGRSQAAARRHGMPLRGRSRQFVVGDFQRFDYIVAMDRANRRDLLALAPDAAAAAKVSLLRDHDPEAEGADVPDPYYGAGDGFERVFQICLAGGRGLLAEIRARHNL